MSVIKPQPNRRRYIESLRAMTPSQRVQKAFELSELTHDLLRAGIAERYPDETPEERHALYLEKLERCRKRSC